MEELDDDSVDLVVTSPPYPMIEMWDDLFKSMNEEIQFAIQAKDGKRAFNLMHQELNKTWKDCARIIQPGGLACINIGDATRSINNKFQLYPNHVEISRYFNQNGFISLPCILWRKPTNSPTKFLGSGMLPTNAYVTLEHEYILLFRKGLNKRKITPKSSNRYEAAYFWEERNAWFTDIWEDIRGTSQYINDANDEIRERSAAFPLELCYRLVNMFSIYQDTVLDPFWGTGTTTLAAMISGRNSIGYELNPHFKNLFEQNLEHLKDISEEKIQNRLKNHVKFINQHEKAGKEAKYEAKNYDFSVITNQEDNIQFYDIENIKKKEDFYDVFYSKSPFRLE